MEYINLQLGLNTLCHHMNTQIFGQPDKSGNDFLSLGIGDITEKLTVQLDCIHIEILQQRQGGIADPEVVE